MGMLNKNNKKNLLNRGAKIQVDNKIDRLQYLENEPKKIVEKSSTFRVSAKIDNHTRNKLQSLVILGYANSIAELIKDLTDSKVDKLKDSENERFNFLFETYELQDSKKK